VSASERRKFAIAFGKVLKLLRNGAHLSQELLAERAGLSRTAPSLLERGERSPTSYNLVRIARALGVDPPLLLRMTLRRMEVLP
jgi:transcriptional regulator with XRE-family HTH domain